MALTLSSILKFIGLFKPQVNLRAVLSGEGIKGEENGGRALEPYERLLDATKLNKRLSDNEQYHDLMTADFEDVYTHPCENDYHAEWNFIVKFKNTELNANIKTDEPCVVLWDQESYNMGEYPKRVIESGFDQKRGNEEGGFEEFLLKISVNASAVSPRKGRVPLSFSGRLLRWHLFMMFWIRKGKICLKM